MICKKHVVGNVMATNCPVCLLDKVIRENKLLKMQMPFYKMLVDKQCYYPQGIGIKMWKRAFPNFYAWLMDNGFRYDKTKDKTIRRTVIRGKQNGN
jgi:hypothetical protein